MSTGRTKKNKNTMQPRQIKGLEIAVRVASSLLRDRVFEEVRVKRNLSYAPDAFLRSQSANIGGLYVTAVDANQAVRVMLFKPIPRPTAATRTNGLRNRMVV